MAGVGARDRSTMPKGTLSLLEASCATNCPMRVILKAVRFMSSAISVRLLPAPSFCMAARTTPGPETPTFITQSGSPGPWKAPAMKGLSSGALQKTTSFAAPMHSRSVVSSAVRLTIFPIFATASMFIPAFVLPTFTEEQTSSVSERASGMLSISA